MLAALNSLLSKFSTRLYKIPSPRENYLVPDQIGFLDPGPNLPWNWAKYGPVTQIYLWLHSPVRSTEGLGALFIFNGLMIIMHALEKKGDSWTLNNHLKKRWFKFDSAFYITPSADQNKSSFDSESNHWNDINLFPVISLSRLIKIIWMKTPRLWWLND